MNALITGASSGIGLEISRLLNQSGYTVYGISRSYTQNQYMKQVKADVSDPGAVRAAVKRILQAAGHIDCLIVCAGISLASPAERTDLYDARDIFEVNFWGCVHVIHEVVPHMKEQKQGRLILVSSITGLFPVPYLSYYNASKAALLSYGSSLAGELREFSIKVTTVLPGGVQTEFTKKRKKYKDKLIPALKRATITLGKEEQHGMSPEFVAGEITQQLRKKNPPVYYIIGTKYKVYALLGRILPSDCMAFFIRKKYLGLFCK